MRPMLKRLAAFYSVRVVSYTFMSNHFHIILQVPLEAPSEEEAAARYAAFHRGKREIRPGPAICREGRFGTAGARRLLTINTVLR